MNDSMTDHQFKIKEPNGWSTYCRNDNTLHEDEVSHSDSYPLPATRGCHLPPATCHLPPEAMHPLKGKPETGMDAAGMIHSR